MLFISNLLLLQKHGQNGIERRISTFISEKYKKINNKNHNEIITLLKLFLD